MSFVSDLFKEKVDKKDKWSIGRVSFGLVLMVLLFICLSMTKKLFYYESVNVDGIRAILTTLVWVLGLLASYIFGGKFQSMFTYKGKDSKEEVDPVVE